MEHVPLGATGVSVSALCLGTMRFGTTVDETTSWRLLDDYVAAATGTISVLATKVGSRPSFASGTWPKDATRHVRARDCA